MTASDHLGQQFSTWYHGTSQANAESIRANGLTASEYGAWDEDVAKSPTLTSRRDLAAVHARKTGGDQGAIVEVHVPHVDKDAYLVDEHTHAAGLHKPLPASMIHHTEAESRRA